MNTVDMTLAILKELEAPLSQLDPAQINALEEAVLSAKKVFVAGAGRSLLMMRGLAMRLMHMDFEAYVVGETVTPAIGPGDLLIIGSGSGETGTLTVMAEKCKKVGARLALLTIYPESKIGKLADILVRIQAVTTKNAQGSTVTSIQPGANMFEQSLLLLCDAMIMSIMEKLEIQDGNTRLMQKHANLE